MDFISDVGAKLTDACGMLTLFLKPSTLGWTGKSAINGSSWLLFMMKFV